MTDTATDTAWARERARDLMDAACLSEYQVVQGLDAVLRRDIEAALNDAIARTRAEERALAAEALKGTDVGELVATVRADLARLKASRPRRGSDPTAKMLLQCGEVDALLDALAAAQEMQEKAVAEAKTEGYLCGLNYGRQSLLARLKAPDEGLIEAVLSNLHDSSRWKGLPSWHRPNVKAAIRAIAAYLETPPAEEG